jgi:hypothetical protein
VRQDALLLLENALVGSGGGGGAAAYLESFRIIMRGGISDKSFIVRVAAARCLKAFANIGGPGLGMADLDTSMAHCVKVLFISFFLMFSALQLGENELLTHFILLITRHRPWKILYHQLEIHLQKHLVPYLLFQ